MIKRKKGFYVLVFIAILGWIAPPLVTAGPSMAGKRIVIAPGEAERCNTDFIVDNISDETADLKVVLGNKVYIDEIMEPKENRAFSLPGTISMARFHGRQDVSPDDVAVIINLGPKAHLRVRCVELKKNPLKKKDDLSVFK